MYILCVVFYMCVIHASSQEVTDLPTTTPTPAVCAVCICTDITVDCAQKNFSESLTIDEWNELSMRSFKEIDLSENSIDILTIIPILPIEKLNISNNKLHYIEPWCFKNLENLTSLDLSSNLLTELKKTVFWGLPMKNTITQFSKMVYLNLAHNDLHMISKDAFSFMHSLRHLDLTRNPLKIIDQVAMAALSELTFLKDLKMSGCGLEDLPIGMFRTLRRLEYLDMSDNYLTTLPSALSEPANLKMLNLSRNPITSLSDKMPLSLSKLKELHLCNTKVEVIKSGELGSLKSLEVLYLCNNRRLIEISEDALTWLDDDENKMWPPITEVHLHNNNLTAINSAILFRWDLLTDITAEGNHYVCDCHAQWMVDVLVPLYTRLNRSVNGLICSRPPELRGLSFALLHDSSKSLICEETNLHEPDVAIVLGVMIGKKLKQE
ncbi:hypothetical protein ACJJTC_019116 [Scirpophaga incertulas]